MKTSKWSYQISVEVIYNFVGLNLFLAFVAESRKGVFYNYVSAVFVPHKNCHHFSSGFCNFLSETMFSSLFMSMYCFLALKFSNYLIAYFRHLQCFTEQLIIKCIYVFMY